MRSSLWPLRIMERSSRRNKEILKAQSSRSVVIVVAQPNPTQPQKTRYLEAREDGEVDLVLDVIIDGGLGLGVDFPLALPERTGGGGRRAL